MSSDEIRIALESYLDALNHHQQKIIDAQMKFRIALADTLKLLENESATLEHLHGSPEALKGYLIKMNENLFDTTRTTFESLRKDLQPILELV